MYILHIRLYMYTTKRMDKTCVRDTQDATVLDQMCIHTIVNVALVLGCLFLHFP